MSHSDPTLSIGLYDLAPPGVRIGHRLITDGDENALLQTEVASFRNSITKGRRQSGAVRIVARGLLSNMGFREIALPRAAGGSPIWPATIVGSLAHDDTIAVAAVAYAQQLACLGIDIESPEPLPPELISTVTTPSERRQYSSALIKSRLFFVIKEATYKALQPIDGIFLDFHDMEIDLNKMICETSSGMRTHISFILVPRVVAISFQLNHYAQELTRPKLR